MKFFIATFALTLATYAAAKPEEYPVKTAPFTIGTELEGILIPSKTQTLALSPESWSGFKVESIGAHGSVVKAGEALIIFETDAIEKALQMMEIDLSSQKLRLAIAERELAELQQRNALTLAESKRNLENAEADLKYHLETGLPASKIEAEHRITQAADFLSYQKEEEAQLLKMYEEDDLTEETEEIILVRQRAQVRNSQMNLEKTKRETARTLEVALPRQTIEAETKVEDARIGYATAKLNLARAYELKKLDLAKLQLAVTETEEKLADTQQDRALFETVAEFDGNLVYGEFSKGKWQQGKTSEYLKPGKSVPTETIFLTLVATDSPLALNSTLTPEKAETLTESLANRQGESPTVTLAHSPNLAGEYLVTIEAKEAQPFQAPGQKTKQDLIFYSNEEAITLPKKAIQKNDDDSSYVLVKLSEGEPEQRTVELGRSDQEVVEILSGLEEGQVVLVP